MKLALKLCAGIPLLFISLSSYAVQNTVFKTLENLNATNPDRYSNAYDNTVPSTENTAFTQSAASRRELPSLSARPAFSSDIHEVASVRPPLVAGNSISTTKKVGWSMFGIGFAGMIILAALAIAAEPGFAIMLLFPSFMLAVVGGMLTES